MKTDTNIKYAQNFTILREEKLKGLVSRSGIEAGDLVLDIGAGKGSISGILLDLGASVKAYEFDIGFSQLLESRFGKLPDFELIPGDFLKTDLSKLPEFKVFANIPFFLTAEIVRKLFLDRPNKLKEAYLFMESPAAYRLMADSNNNNLLSLTLSPKWNVEIVYHFKPQDFNPIPNATIVLVAFKPKAHPLLSGKELTVYNDFIAYLLNLRKHRLKNTLEAVFTFPQISRIRQELSLNLEGAPSTMKAELWPILFKKWATLNPEKLQTSFIGAKTKLDRHQEKLNRGKVVKN